MKRTEYIGECKRKVVSPQPKASAILRLQNNDIKSIKFVLFNTDFILKIVDTLLKKI